MAYNINRVGYQYETSPRKLKPEYEPQKNPYAKKKSSTLKKNAEKEKNHLKPRAKVILYIIIGFTILLAISYRNSLITESFSKKEELKNQLSTIQKENAQLQISIQNSLNLANIEKSASSKLGMQKLAESQKIYVTLPKRDYVEPASEQVVITKEKGWLQKIIDNISNIFE